MSNYQVIAETTISALESKGNHLIGQGYLATGGVFVTQSTVTQQGSSTKVVITYHQAFYKPR